MNSFMQFINHIFVIYMSEFKLTV